MDEIAPSQKHKHSPEQKTPAPWRRRPACPEASGAADFSVRRTLKNDTEIQPNNSNPQAPTASNRPSATSPSAPIPRVIRYSHTRSPRPSAPGRPRETPSRCRFRTSYPPFSDFRKCRSCAEIEASPYRVSALSSPSVSQDSQSAADSITSRIISRCDRNRRASYSPLLDNTLSRTPSGIRAKSAAPPPAPFPLPPKFSPAPSD